MKLHRLDIHNFSLFKEAGFLFGAQLNVILGENGTGKSQLMKLIYAVVRQCLPAKKSFTQQLPVPFLAENFCTLLGQVYRSGLDNLLSMDATSNEMRLGWQLQLGTDLLDIAVALTGKKNDGDSWHGESQTETLPYCTDDIVYLPSNELLTTYEGFYALNDRYHLPYDGSDVDAIISLGLPYLKEVPDDFQPLVREIEKAIGGVIYLEESGRRFMMKPTGSDKPMEINLVATGWRHLGMLMQLLRNGGIGKNSIILWDEPDDSLNPKLVSVMAKLLGKLAKAGIQVFVTTHSLSFLDEMEILVAEQKLHEGVRYFNLQKGMPLQQGNTLAELKNVLLIDEDMRLSDRYLSMEM